MKKTILSLIGIAALMLSITTNSNAQCSPAAPTLWGFNRIDGYVCQAMIVAPAGLVVEVQITARNRPPQDGVWRAIKVWRIDGQVYGPLAPFKHGKYTLWARVKDGTCPSQAAHWNL